MLKWVSTWREEIRAALSTSLANGPVSISAVATIALPFRASQRAGRAAVAPHPEGESLCLNAAAAGRPRYRYRPDFFWLIATLTSGIGLPVNFCDVLCVQTDGAVHV
jgi:hypothetical protein